ncbi:GntR family transcriptional regulator [Sphingobacterium endophyticum]|uniref:GntR family transcriptional regulator n=1 Tax=Sphingobacterium endophyticum TaxID=2546448 RepID=UPI0012E18927|nr:GntR family transcriptional regulator [Sphingobacterium endophyticum]
MQFQSDKPIYLQIIDLVMEKILIGEWKVGEKILSVREFAASVEVNPNTVMRSYDKLQQDEIIFNKRGLGLFVKENAVKIIMNEKKANFLQHEAPKFFQTAKLLNIEIDELIELFKAN